jgi:hypothetical protein
MLLATTLKYYAMIFLPTICKMGIIIVKVSHDVERGLSSWEYDPSKKYITSQLINLSFMDRPEIPSAKTVNYTAGKLK